LCVTGHMGSGEGAAVDGRPQGTVTERGWSLAKEIAGGEPMPGRYARIHRVAQRDGGNEISRIAVASEHGPACRGREAMVARSSLARGGSSLVQRQEHNGGAGTG
jgi:hypothetical protein